MELKFLSNIYVHKRVTKLLIYKLIRMNTWLLFLEFKKTFSIAISLFSLLNGFAADPSVGYQLYGFVRNDFYINSRQNFEVLDGLYVFSETGGYKYEW